jgi:predicted DNA-binding transcriptional regulator YafY
MNRIDRISAILIQLQSSRVVKAQSMADRFGISLRTVYRDIRSLEEAGVPIIGEAGVGYSLVEGYRLPPVMFTRDEAIAFITAEKLVEKLTDPANGSSYNSAMYKIKAVLRTVDKEFLDNIDSRIEVLQSRRAPQVGEGLDPIQGILMGIAQKKVIYLKYFSHYRQAYNERHIEPVGVFYLDNYWHLIAFCRLRKDYRDFRFDRMREITVTDELFTDRHLPLSHFVERLYTEHSLHPVTMQVTKSASLHLGEQKYYHGYVDETDKGEYIEMNFLTMHLEGFVRWYMMFADCATIIRPVELKHRVKEIAEDILKNL